MAKEKNNKPEKFTSADPQEFAEMVAHHEAKIQRLMAAAEKCQKLRAKYERILRLDMPVFEELKLDNNRIVCIFDQFLREVTKEIDWTQSLTNGQVSCECLSTSDYDALCRGNWHHIADVLYLVELEVMRLEDFSRILDDAVSKIAEIEESNVALEEYMLNKYSEYRHDRGEEDRHNDI